MINNKILKNRIHKKLFFVFSLLLLFIAFTSLSLADSQTATVTSVGPGAGTVMTVCVFDPTDANIMYGRK